MSGNKATAKKQYTIHLVGSDRTLGTTASGFTVNKENGIIEFSDADEQQRKRTLFLHAVAYIEEAALVDPSTLPRKYGRSRS